MTPLSLSLLLLLSLSSSPSLLTSATASAPRSSPYPALLDNYLDATDYDDDSPSPSPTSSSSSSVKSPALTPASPSATSPAPTASAPALSPATSPSPFGSDDKQGSSGTDTVAAGVVGAVSGVLDPSLKPICAAVPFPAVCEANMKAAAPESLKSVDVRSAFHLIMEAYTDEIREIRDKSRALVTSDLYSDPLNMCNRSLGGMLRTSKEMVTAFESDDGGTLKSGMDSLVSSLLSCKEKPTVIQKDMERLYNIWDNIEAIFEKLYPELDPSNMFPR